MCIVFPVCVVFLLCPVILNPEVCSSEGLHIGRNGVFHIQHHGQHLT